MNVRVGHSPDPDDAFMYWALTTDLVDTRGFRFEQVLADIQTLNQWARAARLEVTAISLAAYPFVQDDYALLPHGASIGAGYGPVLVAREPIDTDDLAGREIVIPGALTTAFLTLRLVLGDFPFREVAFELIPDEVASGRADLGLLIHEGQLTFSELGLAKVLDLGEWWLLETGLPLPLGVNVVRRDVERLGELSEVLHDAIECGLDNREEALEYALQFGRGIDAAVADRFVSMYVNDLTKDYGEEGRTAVAELLRRGDEIGAFPSGVVVDWVECSRVNLCGCRTEVRHRRNGVEARLKPGTDALTHNGSTEASLSRRRTTATDASTIAAPSAIRHVTCSSRIRTPSPIATTGFTYA